MPRSQRLRFQQIRVSANRPFAFILSDISGLVCLPLKKNMLSGKSSFRVYSWSDLTARNLKLSSGDRRVQILKVKEIGH